MAIYHMHSQAISRSDGRSIVAAMAYRSAEKLHDARLGVTYDYTRKAGVVHSEIMAPEHAAAWMRERETLWNGADAAEKRCDAQMGREVRVALPAELSTEEQLATLREFVQTNFVSRGMVADFSLHHDNPQNPHAHIVLTTRSIDENGQGFGRKCRDWNDKKLYLEWRQGWANHCNRSLECAGIDMRIDHRSYAEQGIALEPSINIGRAPERAERAAAGGGYVTQERLAEQDRIMRRNGDAIIADPAIALDAITRQRATFTRSDVGRFLHTRTLDSEQFTLALGAVMNHADVVRLGVRDAYLNERFTTVQVRASEQVLMARAEQLQARCEHFVDWSHVKQAEAGRGLSDEQRHAMQHVLRSSGIAVVEGYAGTGKSRMLDGAREAWSGEGYHLVGAALSGKAAEGLEQSSGIQSRTLASLERAWERGSERLTHRSVLVVDEAGMVGSQQMARVLTEVHRAGAKLVLVGDTQQLQAIEAGAPMRAIGELVGRASLEDIRRQHTDWQRDASLALARGDVDAGLSAYAQRGHLHTCRDTQAATEAMVRAWSQDRAAHPEGAQIMLAFRRSEVDQLNALAREARAGQRELGHTEEVKTHLGPREFSEGDRVYFCRNDHSLGVKNGSLGTVEGLRDGQMSVALDGGPGSEVRRVAFDTRAYDALDHGYAATVHKAQGLTVERAYVLGSELFDRNVTNVAMTRHTETAEVFVSRESFASQEAAFEAMGRARPKDMAMDYDAVAREADRQMRQAAAGMEAQREARERGHAPQQTEQQREREPEVATRRRASEPTMQERAQDPEARDARVRAYYSLESQRSQAARTLEDGRTTMQEVWRSLPEVDRAYNEMKHFQRLHDDYSKQQEAFRREHPIRAALGLDPKVYDHQSGVERPLGELARAAERQLNKETAAWERVRSAPGLQATAQKRADAQNARVATAERHLPNIKQALQDREPQHRCDMQAKQQERDMERARSREMDRGMDLGR